MNRNLNAHFSLLPDANIRRSRMDRDSSIKTSFNVGQVIPFYLDEVLPGDTHQIKTNFVVRMQPLVTAPMDDIWLDTYYFFVPNRLTWQHWKEFNGENTESAWYPTTEYSVPQLVSGEGFEVGSIADYFGLPVGVSNLSVNALPFRAYSLIMNEWFRDENLLDPLETPVSDAQQTYTKISAVYNPQQYANGGKPFIAAKAHDYFTSCLPSPQKGPDVNISVSGFSPLTVNEELNSFGGKVEFGFSNSYNGSQFASPSVVSRNALGVRIGVGDSSGILGASTSSSIASSDSGFGVIDSSNLGISGLSATTVNQLRQAIALQQLYEIDARSGSRYTEIIKGHFGVTSPDSRLQRPEYLGGNRISINVNQVVQNSASTDISPQGNVSGQSVTSDSHGDFIQSFSEHGYIIGVCVARYAHTYQQGIDRTWSRKSRFDYYWPGLANIGEMAVLNKEIYAQGTAVDDEVFGYQEAWADYRYKPSRVTGEMRSNHNNTLDSWHFADDYETQPYLSADWIREDKNNVDRALAVTSAVSNQLFADFYVQNTTTRPMPLYSIPGLERI